MPCTPTESRAEFIMMNMYSSSSMRLAHQIADGAVVIAVRHHAGRTRMDAEFVFDRDAAQIVGLAEAAVGVDETLRDREQRDALDTRRRTIDTRQQQMHDVLRQIVLPVGDENLLPVMR